MGVPQQLSETDLVLARTDCKGNGPVPYQSFSSYKTLLIHKTPFMKEPVTLHICTQHIISPVQAYT